MEESIILMDNNIILLALATNPIPLGGHIIIIGGALFVKDAIIGGNATLLGKDFRL